MDVVSTINSAVDPVYASNKACKRICLRLRTRNQRVQYVSLQLLENCMRSCGESFHIELSKSDLFNSELARMADRSVWCATEIQRLVLALIQEWAYEIKIPAYSQLYNKLQQRGLPFGPRGIPTDQIFQPYTQPGGGTVPNIPGSPSTSASYNKKQENGKKHQHGKSRRRTSQDVGGGGGGGGGTASASLGGGTGGGAHLGPDLLRPGRSVQELQADVEVARGTITLLHEVLDGIEKEGDYAVAKEEYCAEVAGACTALKDRVAGLLGSGLDVDEGVVAAAIEINDDAQRALDRRSQCIDIADGRRSKPHAAVVVVVEPVAAGAVPPTVGGGVDDVKNNTKTKEEEQQSSQQNQNLMDLLDLDWAPEPDSTGGTAKSDPFLPPPPMIPPPMNNPFAAAALHGGSVSSGTTSPSVGVGVGKEGVMVEKVEEQREGKKETVAVSGGASPVKAAVPAVPEQNPFLDDDAFAQLTISRPAAPAPASSIPVPVLVPVPVPPKPQQQQPSGNPFASLDAATTTGGGGGGPPPPPPPSFFARPPELSIPGGGSGSNGPGTGSEYMPGPPTFGHPSSTHPAPVPVATPTSVPTPVAFSFPPQPVQHPYQPYGSVAPPPNNTCTLLVR